MTADVIPLRPVVPDYQLIAAALNELLQPGAAITRLGYFEPGDFKTTTYLVPVDYDAANVLDDTWAIPRRAGQGHHLASIPDAFDRRLETLALFSQRPLFVEEGPIIRRAGAWWQIRVSERTPIVAAGPNLAALLALVWHRTPEDPPLPDPDDPQLQEFDPVVLVQPYKGWPKGACGAICDMPDPDDAYCHLEIFYRDGFTAGLEIVPVAALRRYNEAIDGPIPRCADAELEAHPDAVNQWGGAE